MKSTASFLSFCLCASVVYSTQFSMSVGEITHALESNHTNPLENLIISKVVALMNEADISIKAGALVYDDIGETVQLKTDCSDHIQMQGGWEIKAVLKPDTEVTIEFGVNGMALFVEMDVLLDTSFHVTAPIHLAQGAKDPFDHNRCKVISTEDTSATVDGGMKLQTYISLVLQPTVKGNESAGFHLAFDPNVRVAGSLVSFVPTASSKVSIFGIDIHFIEKTINGVIVTGLSKEVSEKQVQKEFASLQKSLQSLADKVWPPTSKGELPGITADLLAKVKNAATKISTHEKSHYP